MEQANSENYRLAARGATIGIVANAFLAVLKVAVGVLGASAALVADGVHSASDIISSVIVFTGLKIAAKPRDEDHPYGHGGAEFVAAKIVAGLLVGLAVLIVVKAFASFEGAETIEAPSAVALYVAFFSIAVKEALFRYKFRLGKKTGSQSVTADAWHHRSDAFTSIVAFVGIGGSIIGGPEWHVLDHVGAIVVGVVIGWVGVRIFIRSADESMGRQADEDTLGRIRALAGAVEGVKGVEKLFARKSGLDLIVEIHVEVEPSLTVREGHKIAGRVREKLTTTEGCRVLEAIVHIEPFEG